MSQYKIAIVGGGAVGKSSLTIQFMDKHFEDIYDPTIENSYTKEVDVDNEKSYITLLDTAGQEEFAALREPYMRENQGFILVYSITEKISLQTIQEYYEQILRVKEGQQVPMILLGNKADLEEERQISRKEGENLANSLGIPFFETSAKTGQNVAQSFHEIIRMVRKYEEMNKEKMEEKKKKKKKKRRKTCCIL